MKSKISILFLALGLLAGCQQSKPTEDPRTKKGVIKVTIFYPGGEGKTFDMDYYTTKHFPLVASLMGDSLKAWSVDKGIAAGAPDSPVPYVAVGYLYFEKISTFKNSMAAHGEKIRGDIPNYTNIVPVVQISEVME